MVSATDDTTADIGGVPRCRRCRRPLRSDLARAAGLGPICAMAAIARVPFRDPETGTVGQLSLLDLIGGEADG
jgi:hypothetical protein